MKLLIAFMLFFSSPAWPYDAQVLPGDSLIIINKKTNELAYFDDGQLLLHTKVATGKTNDLTPEGLFTIKVKAIDPYYRKKNISGGDPTNPLGSRWVGFDALGTDGRIYGLHGTNQPSSIGKYISHGCIRLPKRELELLYNQLPIETKILVTNSKKTFFQLARDHDAIK